MLRPRIIVSLLINNGRLVKTKKFSDERYIGDPLNAVRIYNEKQCDELIIFDISASNNNRDPDYDLLEKIATVSNMPLCYGGGVTNVHVAEKLIRLGFEKISVSTQFLRDTNIVKEMSEKLGAQSVVVTLDVVEQRKLFKKEYVLQNNLLDTKSLMSPIEAAKLACDFGAGEIIFNSISLDGLQAGYDLPFAKLVKEKIDIPVSFLGGCSSLSDMIDLLHAYGHCGCAAGSLFIYKGKLNGILINYPNPKEKIKLMGSADV